MAKDHQEQLHIYAGMMFATAENIQRKLVCFGPGLQAWTRKDE